MAKNKIDLLSVGYAREFEKFNKLKTPNQQSKTLNDAWEKAKEAEQIAWDNLRAFDYSDAIIIYQDEITKLGTHKNSDADYNHHLHIILNF